MPPEIVTFTTPVVQHALAILLAALVLGAWRRWWG
jgi:hypothetical protein